MTVEVVAPDVAMGDLTGDLAGRRGHVTGTQSRLAGTVSISALAPLAELENYRGRLKSLTGGKGAYSIAFSHYAQAPGAVQHELANRVQGSRHRRLIRRRALRPAPENPVTAMRGSG